MVDDECKRWRDVVVTRKIDKVYGPCQILDDNLWRVEENNQRRGSSQLEYSPADDDSAITSRW